MEEIKNILEIISSVGILGYLTVINFITFCAFAVDKLKAMTDAWRISEKTLLTLSVLGGAVGGWIAMQLCRHKTKTPVFKYGLPVMIIVHIIIIKLFVTV